MSNEQISMRLELSESVVKVPPAWRAKWKDLVKQTGYDAPYLIFLAELLGLMVPGSQPVFSASWYSESDMFGGRDQRWTINAGSAVISRHISQEISYSWQRVEVEADKVSISGLPDEMYITWDGSWDMRMSLTIGNIPASLEKPILTCAEALFRRVEYRPEEVHPGGRLRSDLKRELKSARTGDSPAPAPSSAEEIGALTALLEDQDSDVAVGALKRLSAYGIAENSAIKEAVLAALRKGAVFTRWEIIEMLGSLKDRQFIFPLMRALYDENGTSREKALEALRQFHDPWPVPTILLMFDDSSSRIRRAALSAASELVSPGQAPAFVTLAVPLLGDEDRYVKETAAYILRRYPYDCLIEPFVTCLRDRNEFVRSDAAFALGEWGDGRAVPGLIKALRDDNDNVTLAVIEALQKIGDARGVNPLKKLIEQQKKYGSFENKKISKAAGDAMKKIISRGSPAGSLSPLPGTGISRKAGSSLLYLQNLYFYRRILEYDPCNGEGREMPRIMIPAETDTQGMYIEKKGDFYGVHPSPGGPVFFHNGRAVPLKKGIHRGEFTCGEHESSFVLYEQGEIWFSLSYKPDVLAEFDPYSGKAEDFFEWLIERMDDEEFYRHYKQ